MTIKTSTLRPGLLVSFKTSVTGNVRYSKRTIDPGTVTSAGALEARWETERVIADPAEHKRAAETRSRARQIVRSVCADSAFGMLCPENRADELTKAIADARKMADEFNKSSNVTTVNVYVIAGRVASDDVEAMRAINSEVRELLRDMEKGITNLEVKQIRDAANRARDLASMLTADAQTRLQMSIDAARETARNIVNANESGTAIEVDRRALTVVTESRTMFLDLDDAGDVAAPQERGRALDLAAEPEPTTKRSRKAAPARQLDL